MAKKQRPSKKLPKKNRQSKIPFRYPSIKGLAGNYVDEQCIAFHKYDGSNLWFKWTKEKDWTSFGTRRYCITPDHHFFGAAYDLFLKKYANDILNIMRRSKEYRNTKELIAFCEYYGPNTFSGIHDPNDQKDLKLFDIYIPERDFIAPKDFVAHFGDLDITEVVFDGPLTYEFLLDVYHGKYPVTEGVVIKGNKLKRRRKGVSEFEIWMMKIKTKTYLEALNRKAGENPDLKKEYEEMVQLHQNFIEKDY